MNPCICRTSTGDSNKEWVLDTPEKVYQAIYDERTLELAFEGHRWFDLVRSGKAVEVMNQHFTNFYNAYTSNSSPNVNNYYMKSEKFEIDQYCTLFPIPSLICASASANNSSTSAKRRIYQLSSESFTLYSDEPMYLPHIHWSSALKPLTEVRKEVPV